MFKNMVIFGSSSSAQLQARQPLARLWLIPATWKEGMETVAFRHTDFVFSFTAHRIDTDG